MMAFVPKKSRKC